MKRGSKIIRFTTAILAAAILSCGSFVSADATGTSTPSLSVSASLSEDGKTVTATVSMSKSDAISAVQFELLYDSAKLSAENPQLVPPWSGMLAAVNIPEAGRAAVAAATASSGIVNNGGSVATIRFGVCSGASGSAYLALRNIKIYGADGSAYEEDAAPAIGINVTAAASGGIGGAAGTVTSPVPVPMTAAKRLSNVILLQADNYAALIRGTLKHIDPSNKAVVPYVNADQRTMVPLRFIAEALNAKVEWVGGADRQIRITYGTKVIRMTIGSPVYTVNGTAHTMDTQPVLQDGRTRVPLRVIAESFGADVKWDSANHLIVVSPADSPWDLSGVSETGAAALALQLLSPLMRDMI